MSRFFAALCVVFVLSSSARGAEPVRALKAGILGLDTSHVTAFTKELNGPKAGTDFGGLRVVAAFPGGVRDNPSSWDRVPKFTSEVRAMGVEIVPTIADLLQRVDVVMLETVDGRPHLEQARQAIAAGKPLFIDKPIAASLADTIEIFQLAAEKKVPCFSASSLRFSKGFQEARAGKSGKVRRCVAWSPMSTEPHHPDLFWYGIHGVEILFTIMGPGCESVRREGPEKVVGVWKGGREGIFLSNKERGGKASYGAEITTAEGTKDAGGYEGYRPLLVEVARFFESGKPPVNAEETTELVAFMEAADESKRLGGKPVAIADVLNKAKRTVAQRRGKQ